MTATRPTPAVRVRVLMGAFAAAALLGGLALYRARSAHPAGHATDATPVDAFVRVDFDVDALRRSGVLGAIFGGDDAQTVTKLCGFDPVSRVHRIVLTLPENGNGDFGVAFDADFQRKELLACAGKVLEARGKEASSALVKRGSFTIVGPARAADGGDSRPPELAFREGGPYLIGTGEWLGKMVDAVDHPSGTKAKSPPTKPPAGGAATTTLLTATVTLEKSTREKVKAQMAAEISTSDAGAQRESAMAGVLGVSSAALSLYEEGEELRAVAELTCEDAPACAAVARLVWRKQEAWSSNPTLRFLGVAPTLEHLEVDNHDSHLVLRARAKSSDVVRWARMLLDHPP